MDDTNNNEDGAIEPNGEEHIGDTEQAFYAGIDAGIEMGAAPQRFASMEGVGPAIAEALTVVQEYTKAEIVNVTEPDTGDQAYAIIHPNGAVAALPRNIFDEYRTTPKRRTGTAVLLSQASFIDHVNRFADDDTIIYADNNRAKPSLTAILDYHKAGADGSPRFGQHRSLFQFPLSDEWNTWTAKNASKLPMVEFALFLENNIINVMPKHYINLSAEAQMYVETFGGMDMIADPSTLMALATEFQVMENAVASQSHDIQSGQGATVASNQHLDSKGNKLVVPSMFVLGIPVFKNGPVYQIIVRLRYRKQGAALFFWYEMWRTDVVFDHAFDEAVVAVKEGTKKPVLLGRDESNMKAAQHAEVAPPPF